MELENGELWRRNEDHLRGDCAEPSDCTGGVEDVSTTDTTSAPVGADPHSTTTEPSPAPGADSTAGCAPSASETVDAPTVPEQPQSEPPESARCYPTRIHI